MAREVVIKADRESVAQRTHLRIETRVFLASQARDFECRVETIFVESLLTVQLRGPANGVNVVLFDAPEIIFRLSVSKAEHGARVSVAEDVRNAVSIAVNGDVARERRRGIVARQRRSATAGENREHYEEGDCAINFEVHTDSHPPK